jgi:Cu-processing system permease protein
MLKVCKYVLLDIIRNKIMIAYACFLFVVSVSLFLMENNSSKAIMSLVTIVLIVTPLVSLVFTTIHWYNSYEFIELMLSQPVSRKKVLISEYAGVSVSLVTAFLVGVGIPVIFYYFNSIGIAIIITGCLVSLAFSSIAFLASINTKDKAKGIGFVLLLWLYFTIIYDGLVMLLLFSFSDYPLEKLTLVLSSLNPIDLARIFIILQLDISALMGYTGATFKDFFGSWLGMLYTIGVLLAWAAIPFGLCVRCFRRKDI